jgi:hypothetical protein
MVNKIWRDILHNVVYKITNSILCSLILSLVKSGSKGIQISERLPYWISSKSVEEFVGYMKKSSYGYE